VSYKQQITGTTVLSLIDYTESILHRTKHYMIKLDFSTVPDSVSGSQTQYTANDTKLESLVTHGRNHSSILFSSLID